MIVGAWVRGAVRQVALACLLTVAACGSGGSGGQHTFNLPAGSELDTVPGDRVLLVVESKNQCGDSRSCVATPIPAPTPGPGGGCDIGNGFAIMPGNLRPTISRISRQRVAATMRLSTSLG